MAKKSASKPRKKKPAQGWLDPEMAPPSIAEIDGAADSYCDARDARMKSLADEIELKEVLKGLMKKHNLAEYEYDSRIVTLKGDPDVKVKTKKKENVDLDDDSE
jgi:hypothetical protein